MSEEAQLPQDFFDKPTKSTTTNTTKLANVKDTDNSKKPTDEELLAEFEVALQPLVNKGKQTTITTENKEETEVVDEVEDPVLSELDRSIKETDEAVQVSQNLLTKLQVLKRKANAVAKSTNKSKKVINDEQMELNEDKNKEESSSDDDDGWRRLKV